MDEGQGHFEEAFIGSEFNFVGTEGSLHHSKPLTITQFSLLSQTARSCEFCKKESESRISKCESKSFECKSTKCESHSKPLTITQFCLLLQAGRNCLSKN